MHQQHTENFYMAKVESVESKVVLEYKLLCQLYVETSDTTAHTHALTTTFPFCPTSTVEHFGLNELKWMRNEGRKDDPFVERLSHNRFGESKGSTPEWSVIQCCCISQHIPSATIETKRWCKPHSDEWNTEPSPADGLPFELFCIFTPQSLFIIYPVAVIK